MIINDNDVDDDDNVVYSLLNGVVTVWTMQSQWQKNKNKEHKWKNKRFLKYSEKYPSQRHFVHHKSYIEFYGVYLFYVWWEDSEYPPEIWNGLEGHVDRDIK
jgi:hypothetical protein